MDTDKTKTAVPNADQRGPGTTPPLLYKYLDHHGLEAIANLELRITPPNEFNDPFEFTPRLNDSEEESRVAHKLYQKRKGPISYDEFRNSRKQRADEGLRHRFQALAGKQMGVICFSADPTVVTQWAHYADGHRGLVLELNLEEEPFKSLLEEKHWELPRVEYLRPAQRKPCDVYQALVDEDPEATKLLKIVFACAGEKSPEWEIEKEYRLIAPVPNGVPESPVISRLVKGHVMYFLQLTAAAINQVILGARTSEEFEREVRKAAALKGIPRDRVIKARIDLENYCVRA